ncbi:MAG: hAT transposon family protein, partial [Cytophagaceae bacterium]
CQLDRPDPLRSDRLRHQETYELIRDNLTRWNSWHDAAQRALDLRLAVDDFTDNELRDYDQKLARHHRRPTGPEPKAPSLQSDRLSNDDWHIIAEYVQLLKPLKQATMHLQGNVNTTAKLEQPVKGAIWQVLPAFEEILQGFERARELHQPSESQQLSQLPSLPRSPTAGHKRRRTRQSSPERAATTSTTTGSSASNTDDSVTARHEPESESPGYLTLQRHFSANIRRAWKKLDKYYNKSDVTPIHRAAVLLHPRLKWRWFEKYWKHKPLWIKDAKAAIDDLWNLYKHQAVATPVAVPVIIHDEWSEFDRLQPLEDQLLQYTAERESSDLSAYDSPLPYWINKRRQWPQLAQMAFDIYSTPAMSDEPERVFSIAGNTLNPRRRRLTSAAVQQLLCLRSWQQSGVITLDTRLIRQAVLSHNGDSDSESDGDDGGVPLCDG